MAARRAHRACLLSRPSCQTKLSTPVSAPQTARTAHMVVSSSQGGGERRVRKPVPRAVPLLNLPTDAARPTESGSTSSGWGGNDCCSSSGSSATRSFGTSRSESGASRDASPVPRAVPLLNLPTDAARPMENGSSSQGGHGGSSTARSFGTSRSGSGTSRDVSPQRQEGSPTVMRGALSTRFRAERAPWPWRNGQ